MRSDIRTHEGPEGSRAPASERVAIVGAGPGDPGLLTVRALELIKTANAVVYDTHVNPEILSASVLGDGFSAPELYFVGRRGDRPALPREEVHTLLITLARQGKRVVYLAGGDPFVFGHGSEIAQAMHEAEVLFEVVPGVSREVAGPTYAGIPVTHRGMAASVTFVTGRDEFATSATINTTTDWRALAKVGGTIVLNRGIRFLPDIVEELLAGGMPPDTPAAAIRAGTRIDQGTIVTTLSALPAEIERVGLSGAVMVVIGWSVVLRDELTWFDTRPLFGKRIVVAVPVPERDRLVERLRALGATVIRLPAPHTARLDLTPVRDDVEHMSDYGWLIFTSVETVNLFWELLLTLGRDTRALAGLTICAVGASTAGALLDRGVTVDVLPDRFARDTLLDLLSERADVATTRALYLCDAEDDMVLPRGLARLGANVVVRQLFRVVPSERDERTRRRLAKVNLVAFTSPADVTRYIQMVGEALSITIPGAALDKATADALRGTGIEIVAESESSVVDEFADAIVRALAPH